MNRILFLFLAIIASALYSSAGSRVVLDEDFARMPSGTPEVPWSLPVSTDADGVIPDNYTAMSGWLGFGVHQAGGACGLKSFTDAYGRMLWGILCTPPLYLSGDLQVSFRAKRLPGSRGNLWVSLMHDDNPERVEYEQFALTTGWATFTYSISDAPEEAPHRIRFSAEGGAVVIDDVKVTVARSTPPAPRDLSIANHSSSSFTASWSNANVDGYLVNVYSHVDPPVIESGVISEGFDNTGFSEWIMQNVYFGGAPGCYGQSAPAAVMAHEDASLLLPFVPEDVSRISFHAVSAPGDSHLNLDSSLRIDVKRNLSGQWETVRYLNASDCIAADGMISLDADEIGYDVRSVCIAMDFCADHIFYIDDIDVEYRTGPLLSYVAKDRRVQTPEVSFSSLDPDDDYYIYVKSYENGAESSPSATLWFDGIEGLEVTKLTGEITAPGCVDLSWSPMSRAESYLLSLYTTLTAGEAPLFSATVLDDEFEDGPEATLWHSRVEHWDPRGIGSKGAPIVSPYLDLGCNAGRGFEVDLTIITSESTYSEGGLDYPETVRIMVLRDETALHPAAYVDVPLRYAGEHTVKVFVDTHEVRDLSNVLIGVMTLSSGEFVIDRIWVSQTILPGETLIVPRGCPIVTEQPAITLDDLSTNVDHLVSVTARASHGGKVYRSMPSPQLKLHTNMGVDDIKADIPETVIREYDIYGRPASESSRFRISSDGRKVLNATPCGQKYGVK
ncbi:MAG: hypothetical protein K2L73_04650 [Muribaculaceae bacterium]|nr:hypothetical protein [Muribaculaceae bacterium]